MKRTDGEMHYKGVSDTQSHTARTNQAPGKPDPLGPLVERYLLSGDEEAMDRLVEVTRPKLMGVARRIGEPQDAEDAVQGAYMALLRKRGSGLDAPVMPWLLTTVIRLAYRRKAKQGRQRDLAARLAQPHEDVPVRRAPAALDAALEVERELAVRSAVAALPATYRDAVVLRHLEGLTTRETATLLDVPEATLRTRLHRAAKLLRSRMAPALLAAFLFLPWCAADALRRIVPITRPLLTKTAGLYAATTIAVVVGLMWMFQTPTASSGSVAHRPATQEDDAGSGADTPQPGIVPAPKREPVEDEAPDPAADDRPARLPSAPAGHSAAADAEPGSEPLPPDDDAPAPTLPGHRPPFA
ncbi:MAG: sigma-70 family RNA polymerase sigma factor, partial [Planctomycetota bacterium]|nr:sigma-70 family RNA polymerase sigma factor [Planctomycetota bacterium]